MFSSQGLWWWRLAEAQSPRHATGNAIESALAIKRHACTLGQETRLYPDPVAWVGADDWRNDASEFLRGTLFSSGPFVAPAGGDHYHCECCWAKFASDPALLAKAPDLQASGHTATIDSGNGPVVYWVCNTCFDDLAEPFAWKSIPVWR